MQVSKLLKKYVIGFQIFVSVCGTFLAAFFMLERQNLNFSTLFLIFLTFWNGYLYTKFQNCKYFNKILIFNILTGIICLIIIYFNQEEIGFFKWISIVVLGLFYNSKFLENTIRKLPLLKIFYVGLTWALVCSWLIFPIFSVPVFFISWLFVTALVLPFDIRDMNDDEVITFPKVIGIQNTKYFAYLLIFISLMVSIFYLKTEFSLALFLTSVFTSILIYFSKTTNHDAYFSFWVELCSALPFLFVALMHYF